MSTTPTYKTEETKAPLAASQAVPIVIAVVVVACITVVGVVIRPEAASLILTFSGVVATALLAILKQVGEYHDAVNSKMDKMMILVARAAKAEGITEERERVAVLPPNAVVVEAAESVKIVEKGK